MATVGSIDRWVGKTAIVTGASSGIGAAIAEKLVDIGITVVGLARRVELVEELSKKLQNKKGKLYSLKTDISKEEDILKAFDWVKNNVGPVYILVNNAGLAQFTTLYDGETEKWRQVFDTNVMGLCIATREAIKDMKENNVDGHIIHINSIAGHTVPDIPGINVYSASKHAVTALTETLRQELNSIKSKIKISDISPGAVSTNFVAASGLVLTEDIIEKYKNCVPLKPEDVADAVVYCLATPPHVQIRDIIMYPTQDF